MARSVAAMSSAVFSAGRSCVACWDELRGGDSESALLSSVADQFVAAGTSFCPGCRARDTAVLHAVVPGSSLRAMSRSPSRRALSAGLESLEPTRSDECPAVNESASCSFSVVSGPAGLGTGVAEAHGYRTVAHRYLAACCMYTGSALPGAAPLLDASSDSSITDECLEFRGSCGTGSCAIDGGGQSVPWWDSPWTSPLKASKHRQGCWSETEVYRDD